MSNISTSQLKAIAKERALDRYGTLIFANILIFVIQVLISGITTVASSGNIIIFVINQLINLIVSVLLGILASGKAYLYMNLVYSQTISASDIFFGLKQHPEKAVVIQAVFVLANFLVTLPSSIILFFAEQTSSVNLYLTNIIILIVGVIVNIYISLIYSQAFFLLHDFPDRSAKELLSTSRRLMQGKKRKLLYLELSFIPMYIFGIVTLFVPLLWISVYRYASVAVFYQNLISEAGNTNTVKEEQYGLN
ncbi:DUF975 family protein [Butyrivibrio sp. VCB2006]|uniref:DUF975 family protein n=1 Tax=Butyrivibrio sp. VCB2006 TaxID=1280679 RepID=UPI0004238F63|nr:DUF975 family protein [Butyrivibrio sp. VCB2006]